MALTPEQLKEIEEALKAQPDLYKEIEKQQEKLKETTQETVDKLKAQIDTLKVLAKETGNYAELTRAQDELSVKNAELLFKADVEHLKTLKSIGAEQSKIDEAQKKVVKSAKDFNDEIDKAKNNARALEKGNALSKLLGIDESNKNSLTYQIFNNPKKVIEGFKEEIQNAGGFAKAFSASIMTKIAEATATTFITMDSVFSSFASATGATAEYNDVIAQAARGNKALGVSLTQTGKATTDLYNNLSSFTTLNKSSQVELAVTTAKLERLGISGADSAKSIGTLSIAMGISQVEAAKVVSKFAAMGQAIGVSSKQMVSDFMAVKDQFAVFGKNMDKTFTDLAAQAKATGVALTDLLNIANKFDTFEGAANQVGKLNAILGGPYLSAMSMIEETDPTKRIDMLRQAVNNANMSFASMSYYEQKAIMEAGGFKSVDEAQKILSMSAGAYAKELENQKAKEDEMNAAIERTIPIKEKLTLLMSNFAVVMQPVVEIISKFITLLTYLIDNPVGRTIVMFITIIGLIKTLRIVWMALDLAFTTSGIGAVIKIIALAVAAFYGLHDALLVPHSPILFDVLKALPDIFRSIGEMALAFAASITVVAFALPIMAAGLFSVAAGIVAFSAAMLVAAGAGVVNSIASLFGADLASQITDIADALAEIPDDKIYNFKVAMEKVVEVSQPTTLAGFEQFAERFDLVAQATAKVDASKTQTFTNMLTATQNLSQALKVNNTVIVKIGEKKFEAIIEEVLNKVMGDQAISRPAGT